MTWNPEYIEDRLHYPPGVSVCIPTWKRAEHLPRRLELLAKAIPDCQLEIVLVMDSDDDESITMPLPLHDHQHVQVRRLILTAGSFPSVKWNAAARAARLEWLFMATDDVEWAEGWWPGYDRLPSHGYLGLHDDLSRKCGSHTLWLARRDWLKKNAGGTLVCPLFRHVFIDVYTTLLAVRAGTNTVARGLIGEHVHAFDEKRSDIAIDESRKRAHEWRDDGKDHEVFEELKARGFPVGLTASTEWKSLW